MFNEFKNKNVVITGHTGFKGSWLTAWMCEMGANVTGIGLEPVDRISNFNVCALANKITDLRINVKNAPKANNPWSKSYEQKYAENHGFFKK